MTNEMRASLPLARFAEQLGVTHKTALSLANRIRHTCGAQDAPPGGEGEKAPTGTGRRAEGETKDRGEERAIAQLTETFDEAVAKVVRDKPAGRSG